MSEYKTILERMHGIGWNVGPTLDINTDMMSNSWAVQIERNIHKIKLDHFFEYLKNKKIGMWDQLSQDVIMDYNKEYPSIRERMAGLGWNLSPSVNFGEPVLSLVIGGWEREIQQRIDEDELVLFFNYLKLHEIPMWNESSGCVIDKYRRDYLWFNTDGDDVSDEFTILLEEKGIVDIIKCESGGNHVFLGRKVELKP